MLSATAPSRWRVIETARDNGHRLTEIALPAPAEAAAETPPEGDVLLFD